jgi:hypothetical protein
VILTVPSILNKLVVHQMKIVHGGHNDWEKGLHTYY